MKVPLVVSIVAVVVILAGVAVRLFKSAPPEPAAEPVPALATEPAPAPSAEPGEPIRFSSLSATDENGDKWTLGLAGLPPEPPEDGVKPGVPLSVKADVQGYGQSVSIGLIIEGQAGEVYQPGAARNGGRRPPPTFTVFDESGTILGAGSFEYG